jgi:hypothetical protein
MIFRVAASDESLSQMPKRCPLARENKYFSQEVRQLLYGRGRNSYRVLFTILEGQDVSIAFSTSATHHTKRLVKTRRKPNKSLDSRGLI